MKMDFSILETIFPQIDTNINVEFNLDGKNYPVEEFNIDYRQEKDRKGQPQAEVKGGQIFIVVKRLPDNNLYDWAKRSNKTKSGTISFVSQTSGTVLRVDFFNGYCTYLSTEVKESTGVRVGLCISSEKITMNGIKHDNKWRNNY